MDNLARVFTGETLEELKSNIVAPKQLQRNNNRANIVFNFEAFQYAEDETFSNDYEFIEAFIIEYNGKKITDYKKTKTKEKNVKVPVSYETARFSASDKLNMMRKLKKMLEFETEKINTKTTQYYVVSVNMKAVETERKKAEFWGR